MDKVDKKDVLEHFGIAENVNEEYEFFNSKKQLNKYFDILPERLEDKKSSEFKLSLYFDPKVSFSVIEMAVGTMQKHDKSMTAKERDAILSEKPYFENYADRILEHFKLQKSDENVYIFADDSEKKICVLKYLPITIAQYMKEKSRFTFHYDPEIPFTVEVIEKLNLTDSSNISTSTTIGDIDD